MHAQEHGAGEAQVEPGGEQLEQAADRHPPDAVHFDTIAGKVGDGGRHVAPARRRDESDPIGCLPPPCREGERAGAGRVEIREIVDRDEHRCRFAEDGDARVERSGDGALVFGFVGAVGLQDHALHGAALRRGQAIEHRRRHPSKEVGESDPRQARFCRGCSRDEHRVAVCASVVDGPLPHRGLADPGVADEQEHARSRERPQGRAFGIASYELGWHVMVLRPRAC